MKTTAEPRGIYYLIWEVVWPFFLLCVAHNRGPLGLKPPRYFGLFGLWGIKRDERIVRRWWKLYIWGSVRRIVSSGKGGISTISFGSLTIVIPWLLWVNDTFSGWTLVLILAGTFLVYIVLLAIVIAYAAFAALRAQPPIDYADIVLSGKTPSEIFRVLAYETRAACREFLNEISDFSAIIKETDLIGFAGEDLDPADVKALKSRKDRIDQGLVGFQNYLAIAQEERSRIESLKINASSQLEIPRQRLCEHILQYRPRTHLELAGQYLSSWKFVSEEIEKQDPDLKSLARHVRKLNRIWANFEKRITVLTTLFENDNLHENLQNLTSKRSTSGAIYQYALALSEFARTSLPKVADYAGNDDDHRAFRRTLVRLRFLYRKQRAYPGLEIHHACLKLCEEVEKHADKFSILDLDCVQKQRQILQSMKDDASYKLYRSNVGPTNRHDEVIKNLTALSRLPITVEEYLGWSREKIAERFATEVKSWLKGPGPNDEIIILTHGYSRTVREVIAATWQHLTLRSGRSPGQSSVGGAASAHSKRPKVFVMHSDEPDQVDASFADTTRMAFELRNDPENPGVIVATGNENVLIGLLNPSDQVLVVLGSEAFDNLGRVVHPRGALAKLEKLQDAVKNSRMFVLAEEYKRHDVSMIKQFRFFTYHLGNLDVYPFDLGHKIITDLETIDPKALSGSAANKPASKKTGPKKPAPKRVADRNTAAKGSDAGNL